MDKNGYGRLSSGGGAVIMVERRRSSSVRAIAKLLSRAPLTVSPEVERNAAVNAAPSYDAAAAALGYRGHNRRCVRRRKLEAGTRLQRVASDSLLCRHWSPQQIAARLRWMYPKDPSFQVCHGTIHAVIHAHHPRGVLKKAMVEALCQHKRQRGRGRLTAAGAGGVLVPEELRIQHRPEEVAERKLSGH